VPAASSAGWQQHPVHCCLLAGMQLRDGRVVRLRPRKARPPIPSVRAREGGKKTKPTKNQTKNKTQKCAASRNGAMIKNGAWRKKRTKQKERRMKKNVRKESKKRERRMKGKKGKKKKEKKERRKKEKKKEGKKDRKERKERKDRKEKERKERKERKEKKDGKKEEGPHPGLCSLRDQAHCVLHHSEQRRIENALAKVRVVLGAGVRVKCVTRDGTGPRSDPRPRGPP
jgi:hypothetical protein